MGNTKPIANSVCSCAMLPCILMSAHWDDLLLEQARLAHAFLVLPKTVTLRQITGAVGQALERTYHWHDATQQ
jgi:hypothetical protein